MRPLLTAFALSASLFAISADAASVVPVLAKVTSVRGRAGVTTATSWARLETGQTVGPGQSIAVTPESEVTVLIPGRSAYWIKGPADIAFERTGAETLITVHKGTLLSAVKPLIATAKERPTFRVRTANAVMGARGTTFFVRALPGQADFVCVCEGSVAIQAAAGGPETLIKAKHHDHPVSIPSGATPIAKRMLRTAMGRDHSDDEIAYLKRLIP